MNLNFDTQLAKNYSSKSQIARVLTEDWVKQNSYCPSCGYSHLDEFENNRPVSDFECKKCSEQFELKSKNGTIGKTITDGAYSTMIKRINSSENPNFFFLTYNQNWSVNNFLIIPKQFFTNDIIIKRKPLAASAKRAGWIGCNINLKNISSAGKVFLVKDSTVINKKQVETAFQKTLFLRSKNQESKGWILDVLRCVDAIPKNEFSLDDVYAFESELKLKHPDNQFIKDKIRQQLQLLRDKGLIEFKERGKYRKVGNGNI